MGVCNSKVAPYIDDSRQVTLDYINSVSPSIIHSLGKIRFSLLNNDTLSTTAINTEGLIDFALVSMYKSVITTEDNFKSHFRFCCTLLHHSSLIVTKLYQSIVKCDNDGDETFDSDNVNCKEPDDMNTEISWNTNVPNPIIGLFQIAKTIQNHPLLSWTNIMSGIIPEDQTVSQLFCLFRVYNQSMLNYMAHCSKTGELPPQTQYRTKVQTYDPSFTTPKAYVSEYTKLDRALTMLTSMCEHVIENLIADGEQQNVTYITPLKIQPKRIRKFSSNLAPVNE